MNKNHIELFYRFLAILSLLNFGNYVFRANWYKYKKDGSLDETSPTRLICNYEFDLTTGHLYKWKVKEKQNKTKVKSIKT